MIEKQVASLADAVADVADGATVMIGGFGTAGLPNELVGALLEQGADQLVRQAGRAEAADHHGRAVGDVGDGLAERGDFLFDHRRAAARARPSIAIA